MFSRAALTCGLSVWMNSLVQLISCEMTKFVPRVIGVFVSGFYSLNDALGLFIFRDQLFLGP